jgi:flagellin-specific chaperone FliS
MPTAIIGLENRLGYEGAWILFLTFLSLYLISQLLRMRKQNREDKLRAVQITIKLLKDLSKAHLSDDQYSRLSETALQAVERSSRLRSDLEKKLLEMG